MKKKFWLNAAILTACSLSLSIAGMGLRVYQTAMIGAEGMGLLQLLLSVYYFATNIAVSGFNLAVTRFISEKTVPTRLVIRKCFALCLGSGLAAGAGLFFGAPLLGGVLLGDARTVPSLRVLALGLPLLSVSCCCRGYFLAVRNAWKPSLGQAFEQISGWIVTVLLLPFFARKGLTEACCAIAGAMTVGELCGNLFIVILTRRDVRRTADSAENTVQTVRLPVRRILAISMPIALGYDLRSALIAVENVLIPAGLKQCGCSYAESLAAYGVVKGMALPTVQFPAAFLTAFSLLLIPEVAQSRASGQSDEIRAMARRVFRLCLAFSSLVVGCFAVFGTELGQVLYGNAETGRAIRILCPLVPFMYLDSIVDAMLKGLDEQMYSLKVNLSDSCIRIVLMVFLLPRLGIYGYITAMYCSILYNASLSIGRLVRQSRLHVDVPRWILLPAFCAAVACLWSRALTLLLPAAPGTVLLCLRLILSGCFYLILLAGCGLLPRRSPHSSIKRKTAF